MRRHVMISAGIAGVLAVGCGGNSGNDDAASVEVAEIVQRGPVNLLPPDVPPLKFKVQADGSLTVDLPADLFFQISSSKVTDAARSALGSLVDDIEAHDGMVEVIGSCDRLGNESFNMRLSEDRAGAIVAALVALDDDMARVTFHAYGIGEQGAAEVDPSQRRVTIRLAP